MHQWLHEYCRLKRQLSLACRRNNSPTVSNHTNHDISSAADNAIFKNSPQNIECSFGCVARSAVLLQLHVSNALIFNFCEQKFIQHGTITIAIDCNGLSLLIFEELCLWTKILTKTVTRLFNVCVRVFCAPNATILLVYISAKIKMSFIWKDDFLLSKSAFSVCQSQAHLAKRIQNHIRSAEEGWNWHELSVFIYEISTSWKKNTLEKNVRWRTLY